MGNSKTHWEGIYQTTNSVERSWTQDQPEPSLTWVREVAQDCSKGIIDVGGGTSLLVDHLLKNGYVRPAVLDISESAISEAKDRLGEKEALVDWHVSDVLTAVPERKFFLWHDRAVFHFLTNAADRSAYRSIMRNSIEPGGFAIIATFAPSGPSQCSGLNVHRFDEVSLTSEFNENWAILKTIRQTHSTPWGKPQEFVYALFKSRY